MNDRDGNSSLRARGLAAAKMNVRRAHGAYYQLKMLVGNYYLLLFKGVDMRSDNNMEFSLEEGLPHQRTSRRTFDHALRHVESTDQRSFFDLGSGKGHALILASRHPFRKIGGVELSAKLHAVCRNNLNKYGLGAIELHNANAKALGHELDEYDVFFLFNPFPCPVLAEVARNLIASVRRRDREVTLIYQNPRCHSELLHVGFTCRRMLNGGNIDRTRRVNLYTYSPEGSPRF